MARGTVAQAIGNHPLAGRRFTEAEHLFAAAGEDRGRSLTCLLTAASAAEAGEWVDAVSWLGDASRLWAVMRDRAGEHVCQDRVGRELFQSRMEALGLL